MPPHSPTSETGGGEQALPGFSVQQLHIIAEADTAIRLNEHKGSAIRGALFEAMRGPERPTSAWSGFCADKAAPHCSQCPVSAVCPVMRLVATLDERGTFGQDAPRPYIINPPLDAERTDYPPGSRLSFDMLLVGEAAPLFPYVVLALERLAHEGIGQRLCHADGRWRRGTARLASIEAVNPLLGERAPVLQQGSRLVQVPALPVTHDHVLAAAAAHALSLREMRAGQRELTLEFLTPLRLVDRGQLVKAPLFRPLLQRLLERLRSLIENFGEAVAPFDIKDLRERAEAVELVADGTRWLELCGYSTRLRRQQQLGGLMGSATYRCEDWEPFLPWLVWGTLLHVGKNAVKGDGWYRIAPPS